MLSPAGSVDDVVVHRPRPEAVWALSVAMVVFGGAGYAVAGWGFDPLAIVTDPLMWLVAASFFVVEMFTIDVRVKSQRHSFSMGEIPLVVGLFYLAQDALVVAAVLGMVVDVFVRRQRGLKAVFNVALVFSMIVMQIIAFELVAISREPTEATAMIGVYVAVALNAMFSHSAVSAAISLVEGLRARALFWRGLSFAFITQIANASLGLIAVLLVELDWRAIFILVTPVLVMYIAYWAMAKRMIAEEKLRASERRFAAMIHASSDITALIDADRTLQYVSEAASDLLGIDTSEVRGSPAAEMFNAGPEVAERFRVAFDTVLSGDEAVVVNIPARRPDGSEVELEINLTNLLDDPGVQAVVMSARDTTQRRRLEERLMQAQKMDAIGQLAGGVAHDFNNLLAVIQNYASFVRAELPPGSQSIGDVDEILKATDTASTLTRQLLSFARKEIVTPRVIDVNELVSGMHRMLSRTIRESIDLQTTLAPDLPRVKIDAGRLEQVLINLAVNAKDAMPDGGTLLIRTYEAHMEPSRSTGGAQVDRYVIISVVDTGIGMSPEVQERIFEPFFTTKEPGKGTGLGLATVYGIVNQFDGHIEVESDVGVGTEFRICLPATAEPVSASSDTTSAPISGAQGRILVAEDSEPLRRLLERILSNAAYEVEAGESGADAFRLWEQRTADFDLLVTDVVMPQMSGRELSQLTGLPTVFISGYTDEIISQEDVSSGGYFLQKPFSSDDLLRVVADALTAAAPSRAR
ncbi:MAG: PAS domain-containing protein [Actinobacteria bacterium]|nr:PAS domain-containing protein [Actinomycetota bacterium]